MCFRRLLVTWRRRLQYAALRSTMNSADALLMSLDTELRATSKRVTVASYAVAVASKLARDRGVELRGGDVLRCDSGLNGDQFIRVDALRAALRHLVRVKGLHARLREIRDSVEGAQQLTTLYRVSEDVTHWLQEHNIREMTELVRVVQGDIDATRRAIDSAFKADTPLDNDTLVSAYMNLSTGVCGELETGVAGTGETAGAGAGPGPGPGPGKRSVHAVAMVAHTYESINENDSDDTVPLVARSI